MQRPRLPKFAYRSADAGRRLDTFLVCAVAAVLGNRAFLIATGYPQVGNSTLHISHAIWGALMMMIAIVAAISFLAPFTRAFSAFLGGAGFGWFIDELGKFVSRDTNYFFEPTIALIYITFIVMYLVFRSIQARGYGPEEAALNAIEALKSASLGRLDEPSRRATLELLDETGASGDLTAQVRRLLEDVPALPPQRPGFFYRVGARFRQWYLGTTRRPGFVLVVNTLFVLIAVAKVATVVILALDGPHDIHGFREWASLVSGLVASALIVIGVFVLPRSRLAAYRWFDRGLLVEIFVTQVFVFAERQLEGIFGLASTIVLWIVLRSAMRAEREREHLDLPASRGTTISPANAVS